MRYFIVGDVAYQGSEVALWQILNTGAPVMEISAQAFAEHKAAYDEFWAGFNYDDLDSVDREYEDMQFYQSGLLTVATAEEDGELAHNSRRWSYCADYGLGQTYTSLAA